LHFWTSRPRYMSCLGFVACGHLACWKRCKQFQEDRDLGQVNRVAFSCLGFCGVWPLGVNKEVQAVWEGPHFWTSRPRCVLCLGLAARGHWDAQCALFQKGSTMTFLCLDASRLGLTRTVYLHRIWLYIWWFPCQEYRVFAVLASPNCLDRV
jgi:hypothetical protein